MWYGMVHTIHFRKPLGLSQLSLCREEFDVAITFEERVMDQLVTGALRCAGRPQAWCYLLPSLQIWVYMAGRDSRPEPADMHQREESGTKMLLVVNMVRRLPSCPRPWRLPCCCLS